MIPNEILNHEFLQKVRWVGVNLTSGGKIPGSYWELAYIYYLPLLLWLMDRFVFSSKLLIYKLSVYLSLEIIKEEELFLEHVIFERDL